MAAVKGITVARTTGAFDTQGQIRDTAAKWVRDQAKKGNISGDLTVEIEKKVKEKNILNYFSHPVNERWELICEIKKKFKVISFSLLICIQVCSFFILFLFF
jgi:hypothetical protein